jgi:hypothetical protein
MGVVQHWVEIITTVYDGFMQKRQTMLMPCDQQVVVTYELLINSQHFAKNRLMRTHLRNCVALLMHVCKQ